MNIHFMRKLFAVAALVGLGSFSLAAIPNRIVYQGRLFKSGLPVTSTTSVRLTLVNPANSQALDSEVFDIVPPPTGEFTIVWETPQLGPDDWVNTTPELKVSVNGEDLLPAEQLGVSPYSFVTRRVDVGGVNTAALQDGAVSDVKISSVSASKVMLPGTSSPVSVWQSTATGQTDKIDATMIHGNIPTIPSAHAGTHGTSGSDPVYLQPSQMVGNALVSNKAGTQIIEPISIATDTLVIKGMKGAQESSYFPLRVFGTQSPQDEKFNLRGDGLVYFKESMGIGTSAPTAKLEVSGRVKDQTGFLSPVGSIIAFGGANAPQGWLLCDGTTYNLSTRPELNELGQILGATFGGDGTATFAVPDLRGRAPIGSGAGPGLSNRSRGQKIGAETHQLTTSEMPSHSHQLTTVPGWDAGGGYSGGAWWGDPTSLTTTNTGGSGAHNIMQPSLALNYIIKY